MCRVSCATQANQEIAKPCCAGKAPAWLKTVDLICRVSLAIFSAVIAPLFFAVSFGVGVALGATYTIVSMMQCKSLIAEGENKPICAQGFMNYLSGMRFPAVINSVVTAVFIAAHVRHDPVFFVPFVGMFVGVWIGCEGARLGLKG